MTTSISARAAQCLFPVRTAAHRNLLHSRARRVLSIWPIEPRWADIRRLRCPTMFPALTASSRNCGGCLELLLLQKTPLAMRTGVHQRTFGILLDASMYIIRVLTHQLSN